MKKILEKIIDTLGWVAAFLITLILLTGYYLIISLVVEVGIETAFAINLDFLGVFMLVTGYFAFFRRDK